MSKIEWTDATWNPVTGCSKVSPGCAHCYAETVALRFWPTQYPPVPVLSEDEGGLSHTTRPRQFTDVICHEDRLDAPLHWRKPRRVFVNSMSDLFHEDVPATFIADVMAVCARTPQHTYQILTKRPERMLELFRDPPPDVKWPLPNVWLGVSVENQHFADERIPLLLRTPAAVRFISAEPLLEPINWPWLHVRFSCEDRRHPHACGCGRLDWVIVGGESGPKARPCDLAWIRSIVQQCRSANVPVFVKQIGSNPHTQEFTAVGASNGFPLADRPATAGDRLLLRDRKGGDMAEWLEDLRVRQFPAGQTT